MTGSGSEPAMTGSRHSVLADISLKRAAESQTWRE